MFMLSYASLATLLLAFFIVLNTFTEEKKKEFIEGFQRSMKRREITFGMGGILSGWGDDKEKEAIRKMKYIYPDEKKESRESSDKGVNEINREEEHIPAAVVVSFDEHDAAIPLEGRRSLNNLIDLIGERPCSLIIEGHTRRNFIPSGEYHNCWKLSLDRAKVVADYLHEKGNISFKRLIPVGYGNNKPLTKDIRSDRHNDRVSIIINILK
ncbi:MAG: H+-driven flagellar motor component MotB [Candidatus Brocadia sinica]|nr:MAG: H+-driven flagellar motor component MotB [Candidatus Brocadia sinica]